VFSSAAAMYRALSDPSRVGGMHCELYLGDKVQLGMIVPLLILTQSLKACVAWMSFASYFSFHLT
jgi:hypothetical protein